MKLPTAAVAVLSCALALGAGGCGRSSPATCALASTPAKPGPAPQITLTAEEKAVWAPLPPDRTGIPVLVYHGIGTPGDFTNASDASYGVDPDQFAKQMTLIKHAGYQTVGLSTFLDFVRGKNVSLPPRPLLLTFDDGRVDSWTGADAILRKLGFEAVMFVDVGNVDSCNAEYLTWRELRTMEDGGVWSLQLHAGPYGHTHIRYGSSPQDTGPFYAYEKEGESFDGWQDRVRTDIERGQSRLDQELPGYQPLAFSPPFGNYGQDGTNDERIPPDLLGWLTGRYEGVFTQDRNAIARAGSTQPLGRVQVLRSTTGGELHELLLSGGRG